MRDSDGWPIVSESYVRVADGKHTWVERVCDDVAHTRDVQGRIGAYRSAVLSVVRPSKKANTSAASPPSVTIACRASGVTNSRTPSRRSSGATRTLCLDSAAASLRTSSAPASRRGETSAP
jgi:hypothetical protein